MCLRGLSGDLFVFWKMWSYVVGGGEWVEEDGKRWWMPSAKGLGFGKVFDMINEIYGADFYRYE